MKLIKRFSKYIYNASTSSTLNTSLISYWKLEETGASNRNDSISTNHLTAVNTPANTTGKIGSALDCVSASTQYLTIASNSQLQTGNIDFTIAFWVQIKDKVAARCLIQKGDALSFANIEYEIYYSSASDRFLFRVSDGTTFVSQLASTFGPPTISTWYFVVCKHVSATKTISISVNNGAFDSIAIGAGQIPTSTAAFRIGARGDATDPANALLDEVGFWKKELSAAEITELYNSGAGKTTPF